MKAIFRHVCKAPAGGDIDAIEIEVEFEIPFVPVAGMLIAPTPKADALKVDEVFWFADKPDRFEMFAVDADGDHLRPMHYWRKQGWKRSGAP
jgi:hypothetical protein